MRAIIAAFLVAGFFGGNIARNIKEVGVAANSKLQGEPPQSTSQERA